VKRLDRRNRHELGVADYFVQDLAKRGIVLTNCRKGDEAAGEPDVICDLGRQLRGIEVVDCWTQTERLRRLSAQER
jgi:hypothetical protein